MTSTVPDLRRVPEPGRGPAPVPGPGRGPAHAPAPAPGREPGSGPRRRSIVAPVIALSIASLPMLMPAGLPPGPGNTGLPDLMLVVLFLVTLMWAAGRRHPLRWPYLVPTLLTIIAGGIATLLVDGAGALTLVKDLFVLLWAVAIANLGRDVGLLRTTLRAWVVIGTVYAAVMILGFMLGIEALSGKQVDGERAMFTFGDANYASNWFICVFFLVRATRYPRRPGFRLPVLGLLLLAEVLTGSNGGALALAVALVVGHIWGLLRTGRAQQAVATAALIVLVGGGGAALVSQIDLQPILDQASAASPILRDSIGRTTGESTGSRSTVLATTTRMLMDQPHPFGIGPGRTEEQMRLDQESYVREAHNDYVAAVLERGWLGGVALIMMIFVLVLRCVRIAGRDALKPEYARLVPHPEMFGALLVVFLISGLFYEVMHYRHGFAMFGVIAALELWGRRGPAERAKEIR